MRVTQEWLDDLSLMQQSVLLTVVRGADGVEKYSPSKNVSRWFRRCILISAFDKCALTDPSDERGGSFTGPSIKNKYNLICRGALVDYDLDWENDMDNMIGNYIKTLDCIPYHFHMHVMHASEILGYHHPDEKIRNWWHKTYLRFVNDMHLNPETKEELDRRLSDDRDQWMAKAEKSTME